MESSDMKIKLWLSGVTYYRLSWPLVPHVVKSSNMSPQVLQVKVAQWDNTSQGRNFWLKLKSGLWRLSLCSFSVVSVNQRLLVFATEQGNKAVHEDAMWTLLESRWLSKEPFTPQLENGPSTVALPCLLEPVLQPWLVVMFLSFL